MGFVIAVDGPAASGKGTIATRLGACFGYPVLDTGLLYRAAGLKVLDWGRDPDNPDTATSAARKIDPADLEKPAVRSRAAGEAASRVAVHPGVRAALLEFQRTFAAREPGAVLDGRDIGTVIAPQAQAKLYVTATAEVRAGRRWRQLLSQGERVSFEEMLADILTRDARDSGRRDAPLVQATDAVLLDTSEMTIDDAFDAARRVVEAARAR